MIKQLALALLLLLPKVCHATVVFTESGDFPGDNVPSSDRVLSLDIGELTDFTTQFDGVIAGSDDLVDAWTFTVPSSWTLTGINVIASGFDGNDDAVDLYSDPSPDPAVFSGDLFTAPLVVGNNPVSIAAGTYKLSALSLDQTAGYSIQLTAVPEASSFLFGGLVAAVVGAAAIRRRRQ